MTDQSVFGEQYKIFGESRASNASPKYGTTPLTERGAEKLPYYWTMI